ncbi:MAG TPA: hypothetical protein VK726_24915 [Acetobacteraceae bacterium]|nr:hypothetical protein [Acetobacteraceae bacterium]
MSLSFSPSQLTERRDDSLHLGTADRSVNVYHADLIAPGDMVHVQIGMNDLPEVT